MMQNYMVQKPNTLYEKAGQRIKLRRKTLGISQLRLAEMLGISYQQVQKYERGISPLALDKVLHIAKILNVQPSHFYEGEDFGATLGRKIYSDMIERDKDLPLNILLVEHEASEVLLFSKAIGVFGESVHVHCISNPEMVMDYLKNCRPASSLPEGEGADIIVMDISMPKMNGLQLLKMIKSNSQTREIPVVILTNSVNRKEMLEAYRLGAAGFMQKEMHMINYRESIKAMVNYWAKVVVLPAA